MYLYMSEESVRLLNEIQSLFNNPGHSTVVKGPGLHKLPLLDENRLYH